MKTSSLEAYPQLKARVKTAGRPLPVISPTSRFPELVAMKKMWPHGPLPAPDNRRGNYLRLDGRHAFTVLDIDHVSSGILQYVEDYVPLQLMLAYVAEHLPSDLIGRVNVVHCVRQGMGYVDGTFNPSQFLRGISFHHFGMAIDFQATERKYDASLERYLVTLGSALGLNTDSYFGLGRSIRHRGGVTSQNPLFHFAFDKVPVNGVMIPVSKLISTLYEG